MIDYTAIILAIIGLVSGGAFTHLFTVKSVKKKAEAEAMQAVQDAYQETITDLREDKKLLKVEKTELQEAIKEFNSLVNELKNQVQKNTADIEQMKRNEAKLRKHSCIVADCKLRQALT